MPAPELLRIPNGMFEENTWLVWDGATRAAVVIDPGEESARILREIRDRQLQVQAIWLTHGHLDHVWGVDDIRSATHSRVLLHRLDRAWYDRSQEQALYYGIATFPELAPPDDECQPGDILKVGQWQFEVRHVPGHSPGHVAFIGHGLCFSGDVLFLDSVGRTDLPGGDSATLARSINQQLLTLPDDTRVLPGHGPETTIGRERRDNPYLQR